MKNNCSIKGFISINAQGEEINYQQHVQGQIVNQIENMNQINNQDEREDDILININ